MKKTKKNSGIYVCRYRWIAILVVLLLSGSSSFAEPYFGFHRGTRTLGMGGAFTAVADDQNALYFNPAGLSQIKVFSLGILNPQVEASENSVDIFKDMSDVDKDDSGDVADVMRKYVGENNHIKVATELYTGFRAGSAGVMVSVLGQVTADIRIRNLVNPVAQINSVADYGVIVGAGMDLPFVDGLKIGAALKGIARSSLNEEYTSETLADDNFEDILEDDQMDGSGISADIGVLYTTSALKVTNLNLALVAQNIPEMDFGDAMDTKTQFNAGIALSQKVLGMTVTEALDVYDFTDNAGGDDSLEKRIHMGVEVALPAILSVRVGLNQGYATAGATLNFKAIKFDVATYGEEIGVVGGQQEDRRYVAQISMGWL
jgi:hypothetical protein